MYDAAAQTLDLAYDDDLTSSPALTGVDNITGSTGSEISGPAFSPDGTRFYSSSQRGTSGSPSGGITYEVTGPFRA